jgi:bifunctional non-homologous end joining protein LigD
MEIPSPLQLTHGAEPFDDPDWIYEIKHDAFRALAVLERGHCRFFSRKKQKLHGFRNLREGLVNAVNADTAILDGELGVTDHLGRTMFASLMKRHHQIRYFAFDLLWLNGQDLRALPVITRKEKLKRILPTSSPHTLYLDHVQGAGRRLHALACQLDLADIVAKPANSRYENPPGRSWIKIKNPTYSQKEGRGDLFTRAG